MMGPPKAVGDGDDASPEQRLAKALGHPLRVEILDLLHIRHEGSPTEFSTLLDRPLGNVAYHFKVLADFGCVTLVRTEQRRGATEHYYRVVPGAATGRLAWQRVPKALRPRLAAIGLDRLLEQAAAAIESGTIESREGATLAPMLLSLDEVGWAQAAEIVETAGKQLEMVEAQSRERLKMTEQEPVAVLAALVIFEAATEEKRAGGPPAPGKERCRGQA
jgi:DNA-binding transcriptional ArsR family regulator